MQFNDAGLKHDSNLHALVKHRAVHIYQAEAAHEKRLVTGTQDSSR